jgi:hypothetical protein
LFGLNPGNGRASENFYRNVFALAAFVSFAAAVMTDSPILFAAALLSGALSRTAVKKNWKNPGFAERFPWLIRRSGKGKDSEDEDGASG